MKTRIRKGHGAYMLRQFFKYIFQSIAGMIGISVYILADTFFISVHSGADGLAVLNLILPRLEEGMLRGDDHIGHAEQRVAPGSVERQLVAVG